MSSLPVYPVGYTAAACVCGAAMFVPIGTQAVCRDCRRGHALFEAGKVLADLRDLAAGRFPFDVLTEEERGGLGLPPTVEERAAIEQAEEMQDREMTVAAEYRDDLEPYDFY